MPNLFRKIARAGYRVYINLNMAFGGMAGNEKPSSGPPELVDEASRPKAIPPQESSKRQRFLGACPVCLKTHRVTILDRDNWKFEMKYHWNDSHTFCEGSRKPPCEIYYRDP